eukprot:393423_1
MQLQFTPTRVTLNHPSTPPTRNQKPKHFANTYFTIHSPKDLLYISLCFYGIKHFYSLLNLKQEVDYFTKLNLQFHREIVGVLASLGCGVFYLMDNDFEIFLDSIPYAYGQTGTNTMNQLALYCNGSGCKHIDKDTDHLFSNLRWPSTTSSPSTKIYAPNMYGTAFIIAGILGISLCFYGIKHFYSLLNLKQEVDYFTKLNLQFHRERRALSKE